MHRTTDNIQDCLWRKTILQFTINKVNREGICSDEYYYLSGQVLFVVGHAFFGGKTCFLHFSGLQSAVSFIDGSQ